MRLTIGGLVFVSLSSLSSVVGFASERNENSTYRLYVEHQAPRIELEDYLSPELRPGFHDKSRQIIVAISGGGQRAGNFGIGAMLALEALQCGSQKDVLKEVDYFSTVSGGGFAAGAYISTLLDHLSADMTGNLDEARAAFSLFDVLERPDKYGTTLRRHLERGYHARTARAYIDPRAIFSNVDRGDFLENALDQFLLGARARGRSLSLADVWVASGDQSHSSRVLVPSWAANATVYTNGAIFPFTPDILRAYGIHGYTHALERRTLNGSLDDMPLSVALKASSTFPFLLPATTLESIGKDSLNPFLQLLDGGLADNLGLLTALSLFEALQINDSPAPKRALILIDAFVGAYEPFTRREGSPTAIKAVFRTTGISLDSWRSRHKWVTGLIGKSVGLYSEPIYLSFDNLPDDLLKRVRDINTNINIDKSEQRDLFEAGWTAVASEKDRICAAVFDVHESTLQTFPIAQ